MRLCNNVHRYNSLDIEKPMDKFESMMERVNALPKEVRVDLRNNFSGSSNSLPPKD
jgi:uncharacterized protein YutE (UPF0331/DUF86 family)